MNNKPKVGARQAAMEGLERFRRDGTWSGAGIDSIIKKHQLEGREAGLAARLCLGVLQNSSLCDFYIDHYCTAKLEPKVRDVLRLGVYQLLFLDRIPDHAAVSESVELCKALGYGRASGLVNAIMRKLSNNKSALPEIPGKGSAQYLSIKYSHPQWMVQYVMDAKGYDFAEAFLAANNHPSGLTIQVNRLKVNTKDYIRALSRAEIEHKEIPELPGCIELQGGSAQALPGFDEGLFYVQDRAARMAVEIAQAKPGMKVLDACSSPGGKSFAAAIDMNNRGSIISRDIHDKKLRLVRSGAERLGIDIITTLPGDARKPETELKENFDLVIADVPCSGLGVIGKKPEIRHKDRESLAGLPEIQRDILFNLADFVKPGGVLLYSTCTVLKEENEDIVQAFLAQRKDYRLEGFDVAGLSCPEGMHSFWPNVDDTDGFFAARLIRDI